jgi:polar amino acid transport system permease protein
MGTILFECLRAFGLTLALTVCAAVLASLAALVAGIARISSYPVLRRVSAVYVEVFRGTSALVQLFWVFFVLPFAGVELNAFVCGVVVLGLNAGAYGAEIVRGAIRALPAGQFDAAHALNLSRPQALYRIVLPQALPAMLPPAGNLAIELLKNTALVSMIAVHDLTFTAQLLRASTLQTGLVFGIVLALYLLAATAISKVVRAGERKLRVTA